MSPSSALANLELLIVSNDYSVLKMFTRAWRDSGSRLDSTPSIACANDLVANRKMHGIVVDMAMHGMFEFVCRVKESRGQGSPMIVACVGTPQEERAALDAGANFVVQKPISTGRVFDLLTLSRRMPAPQRRNYLRHRLITPVTILSEGAQCRVLTSDLSPTGMSIRSAQKFLLDTPLQFIFQIRAALSVSGQGRIMWARDDGSAGIKFDSVQCSHPLPFPEWLEKYNVMMSW